MAKLIDIAETDRYTLSIYECDCGFHLGLDTSYLEQVDEVKTLCPSCGTEIITKDSDEDALDEASFQKHIAITKDKADKKMEIAKAIYKPKNFKEAVSKIAREKGCTEEHIINEELVIEYSCEEDIEEFSTWYGEDGNQLKAGTPIGYSVFVNGKESCIYPYAGLKEEWYISNNNDVFLTSLRPQQLRWGYKTSTEKIIY